jgi:hypothetical protein
VVDGLAQVAVGQRSVEVVRQLGRRHVLACARTLLERRTDAQVPAALLRGAERVPRRLAQQLVIELERRRRALRAGAAVVCGPTTCRQCNRATGMCDGTPKPNRPACDDGNACTTGDRCSNAGVCVPGTARTCPTCNACDRADGMCKPADGMCSDGNSCTTDTCSGGQCVGTPIPMCVVPDAGP